MQEEKLVEMLDRLMCIACDNCSKIQDKTEEEADEICAECPAGERIRAIMNENQRYSEIVLCGECKYYQKDNDCQGTEFAYCRLAEGLDGNIDPGDGCSRGKRV